MAHDHAAPNSEAPRDDMPPPAGSAGLRLTSRLAMVAGLAGGYGLFAWLAGRFMLPAHTGQLQQFFVTRVSDVPVGGTLLYRTPDGRTVNVTRSGTTGTETDFIALSSTCPHLGCQVGWEPQNHRYFCPCHNGTFDAAGTATGGPPGDAGQSLPRYGLVVEKGLLYILVPAEQLSVGPVAGVVETTRPNGPGHDPCLQSLRSCAPEPGGPAAGRRA
jgi:Rieske Fe-S protein